MNKLIRAVHKGIIKSCKYNFAQAPKNSPPTSTDLTLLKNNKFQPNVYGLKLDSHMLPNCTFNKKVILSDQQYNFYQKVSPNYLVGLIQKVIVDSNNISIENQNKQELLIDKFYRISTYCKVRYLGNNSIQLQGLYKAKIIDLQKIQLEKIDELMKNSENLANQKSQEKMVEIIQRDQDTDGEQIHFQKPNPSDKSLQQSIKKLIKNSYYKKKTHKQTFYSLKVSKIQQPPLIITQKLQLKFKFLIDTYIKMSKTQLRPSLFTFNIEDINQILDHIALQSTNLKSKNLQVQKYLQSDDYDQKIDILLKLLQKNMHMNSYYIEIQNQAKNVIRNKKFYEYYSQMMKVAKQAIDGKKTKQLFIEKCQKSFQSMNPPKQIRQVFKQQIQKYTQMEQNSMQAGVLKNYIEQLSKIPYGVKSQQIFDIQFAMKVMDEQHYGMKQVKDAIMQVIAVGKLKKSLKGKIFCFIGGPGLGKTSFAKSVAKALNRKFYNISLGGVSDSSVLKGHRRTYVGAYSGKIIEALKHCGTNNPVILLDQIDKMGSSYHGDPRSQLLQILDPNQNNSFVDNYLDVPVDLSNVLFITSANYKKAISKPLLDRMEIIYLTSYTKKQKIQIFNRHLLKRAIEKSGVQPQKFSLPPQVIEALIEQYSLGQPGVRYLQKSALKLLQKVAYKMLTNQQEVPIKITKQNLYQYLGNSYFRRKDHTKLSKGVALSLGGGDYASRLTYIEAFKKSYLSKKDINRGAMFTGSLGEVFKQAMNISYTFARNFLLEKHGNRYLFENQVHVHAPQGAFKKDGSTDSLTIVAALVSLALDCKVKPGVAMTGQITLSGRTLRTHSIKEKVMVANRQKISEIILPIDNKSDVQNCSQDIKQGITFHYVSNFYQAFQYLFPEKAAQAKIASTAAAQVKA